MKKHLLSSRLLLLFTTFISVSVITSCSILKLPSSYPHATKTQTFEINSMPEGAKVIYEGKVLGTTPCLVTLPLNINYDNSAYKAPNKRLEESARLSAMNFKFMKDGYESETVTITPTVRPSRSVLFYESLDLGLPYVYDYPEGVFCTLDKTETHQNNYDQSAYEKDPTIVKGEADNMVSRDNPGGTALERTIIRWYFDSEPRGARVFWRVVSSIPSVVKNTNELYLGTTPYEDTRSFNILGLTYENSRDVQIEIKLTRPGYMDQVKRFNVRQAIDQQEISSFFDMVEK